MTQTSQLPDVSAYMEENRRKQARLQLMDLLEVPPMSWYENYLTRTMPGGAKDIDVFIRAAQLQKWTVLYGPTGAGKTLVGLAVAAKLKRRYASINFHGGIGADNLIGRWVPCSGTGMPTIKELRERFKEDSNLVNAYIHKYRVNYKWVDGHLTDFFRNGGVLDLAEINMAPPSVTSFLFQMLDDRCQIVLDDKDGEVVRAHPDFWCIANYNEGYAGTMELNDALLRRFPVKFAWGYSDEVEDILITNEAVRNVATKLRESGEVRKDVGTADLKEFCEMIELFGAEIACQSFIDGFDRGEREAVGQTVRAEFSSANAAAKKAAEQAAIENDQSWQSGFGTAAAANQANSQQPAQAGQAVS